MADPVSALPAPLRDLLDAELAAGNRIQEIGHTFPAPPAGAFVMLANPVSSRPRASYDGVDFYERNNSQYCGEFADAKRHFFILEAPLPPPDAPDMDAIRAALEPPPFVPDTSAQDSVRDTLARFESSRELTYERWHDGTGYDLDALNALPEERRSSLQHTFIPARDWRDVEALITIGTPEAQQALREAARSSSVELRLAVLSRASQLFDERAKTATLLMAIAEAEIYTGLSSALDVIEEFHPQEVQNAMFAALLKRGGDVAYHIATSLAVIHGRISSRFDWSLRPMMLQFNTTDATERGRAFLALYDLLGISNRPEFSATAAVVAGLNHLRT